MKSSEGRRLFFGGIPPELTPPMITEIVEKVTGKGSITTPVFANNEKNFAFLEMDTPENANLIKRRLDSQIFFGRRISVRKAAHKAKVWVRNIDKSVSNEILYKAFETFGVVERAMICTRDGKPLGYGFVEFANKKSAQMAVQRCSCECFMLTRSGPPVKVRIFEADDNEDGVPEHKMFRTDEQSDEVAIAPRFAEKDTFEWDWAQKWKKLFKEEAEEKASMKDKYRKQYEELHRNHKAAVIAEVKRRHNEQRQSRMDAERTIREKKMQLERIQREIREAEMQSKNGFSGGRGLFSPSVEKGGPMPGPGNMRPGPAPKMVGKQKGPNWSLPPPGRGPPPRRDGGFQGGGPPPRYPEPHGHGHGPWQPPPMGPGPGGPGRMHPYNQPLPPRRGNWAPRR